MTAAATWWLAVVLGGPIRPTGACLLSRDPTTDHATVRSALRLDSIGNEDDQAAALGDQVDALALVVILARAAGIGRDLETIWNDAMPRGVITPVGSRLWPPFDGARPDPARR